MKSVDVLIVNWNGLEYCKVILDKIKMHYAPWISQIIVVDNASTDGSQAYILQNHPDVMLVISAENTGYAKGNNLGLVHCNAEYVFLLNNDTDVIDSGLFEKLVSVIDSSTMVGAVSPALILRNGKCQTGVGGFDQGLKSFFSYFSGISRVSPSLSKPLYIDQQYYRSKNVVVELDWVSGAAMMVRTSLLKEIGGIPEDYFMYAEDIKLCRMIRDKGYKVLYAPTASIIHFHGGSEGAAQIKTRWIESTIAEYASRKGKLKGIIAKLIFATGFLLRGIAYSLKYLFRNDENAKISRKRMFVYCKAALTYKV